MPNTLRPELVARTVGDVLDAATADLAAAGIDEPRRQAMWLWAAAEGTTVGQAWLERTRPATPNALERFHAALARRAAGEPLAYVVGTAGFRTLELSVDPRVLIPRPETEGLVEIVLAWGTETYGTGSWGTVADIGTGCGCVALSLAVEGRFTRVVATDVSDAALDVAARNLRRVNPPVPVELRCGSLFEPLAGERFDVIVSNPPYVAPAEFGQLAPSVRRFEPSQALVSGEEGMAHIRQLVETAPAHLADGGLLALEVDAERAPAALGLARRGAWKDVRLEPDLFRRDRYLVARKEAGT